MTRDSRQETRDKVTYSKPLVSNPGVLLRIFTSQVTYLVSILLFSSVCHCEEISLLAVGDVNLGRRIDAFMLTKTDPDYPFLEFKKVIEGADVSFLNLECSFARDPKEPPEMRFSILKADPRLAAGIKTAGFDLVSMANNHSLAGGVDKIEITLNTLSNAGLITVGAGRNIKEASALKILKCKDMTIGILAASQIYEDFYPAKSAKAGINAFNETAFLSDIRSADKNCDILVISIHWGKEKSSEITKEQSLLAKKMIDAGGDIILGHHPHLLQAFEIYKEKPIFYSLGNFVFDWKSSSSGTDRSGLIKCYFDSVSRKFVKAELYPVAIEKDSLFPVPATGEKRKEIVKLVTSLGFVEPFIFIK